VLYQVNPIAFRDGDIREPDARSVSEDSLVGEDKFVHD
tara:strand:- start:1935 stop:2048 length:114 start_codon:yes stop_codon:yes gene_type:complete